MGYRPFQNSPPPREGHDKSYESRGNECLLHDLIFWLKNMSDDDIKAIDTNPRVMMFRMAQIICSEWLILIRYTMARLGQIEWELERPDFRPDPNDIDMSLKKLHTWRRRLPLYKIMVEDTEKKLFRNVGSEGKMQPQDCIMKLKPDFDILAKSIDDVTERMHRIATVGLAVTSIEESRRAMEQNQMVGRLTYLAVLFAPLSFVSSFFSMTEDIQTLRQTIWIYFCIAIPVTGLVFIAIKPWKLRYSEMKKSWEQNHLGMDGWTHGTAIASMKSHCIAL
jgi:Mg2+ and Co2+ transporter CorA